MSGGLLAALEDFLEPLDFQLARRLAQLAARSQAPAEAELVGAAAGLCGFWRAQGHACLPLEQLPLRLASRRREGFLSLPPAESLLAALAGSSLVSTAPASPGDCAPAPGEPTPLVLGPKKRLYLWRYFHAEQRLASRLKTLAASPPLPFDPGRVAPLFARLFPSAAAGDAQALAAAACLLRPLWQICGGPGTGKTTTVARLLALELVARPAPPRIALAAPTGKAATRLFEALGHQVAGLGLAAEALELLPRQAFTLHRLLGYRPREESFRYRPGHPLPFDLVVVDEASMVDLLLMDNLFAALPEHGRVVLLGDKDQLASVETGSVFGDLSLAALGGGFREESRKALEPLLGRGLPPENPPRLADTSVELTKSWRFEGQPGIGGLAAAIKNRNAAAALAILGEGRPDAVLRPHAERNELLAPGAEFFRAYLASRGPAEALDRLAAFRLLAALRAGPWGVENLSKEVEKYLLEKFGLDTSNRWYPGRPILVRANDYEAELWNGDLGVIWEAEGQSWAFFKQHGPVPGKNETRRLPLAKLPVHETAWAMTVHQSQGSEFDQVLLVLPAEDHPLVGRELLYTGVTRARRRVDIAGSPEQVAAAINRENRRESGLLDALLAPSLQ
jgi:exodeoxyribonuclease V alpha subunit